MHANSDHSAAESGIDEVGKNAAGAAGGSSLGSERIAGCTLVRWPYADPHSHAEAADPAGAAGCTAAVALGTDIGPPEMAIGHLSAAVGTHSRSVAGNTA